MRRLRTLTITMAASTFALAGCGASESLGPDSPDPTTHPRQTTPTPADIVLDGEPGTLFGSSSDTVDATGEATVSTVNPCPPEVDPMDPVCQGVPDVVVHGTERVERFRPSPADAVFCSVLENIESRPWPTGEFDRLRMTQLWLDELEAVVPDSIDAELQLIAGLVDETVERGANSLRDIAVDPALDAAAATIGDHVDAKCHGA